MGSALAPRTSRLAVVTAVCALFPLWQAFVAFSRSRARHFLGIKAPIIVVDAGDARACARALDMAGAKKSILCGFDTEWGARTDCVALIQLSFQKGTVLARCRPGPLSDPVRSVLEDAQLFKIGVALRGDKKRLATGHGVNLKAGVDLQSAIRVALPPVGSPDPNSMSLDSLTRLLLGVRLDKDSKIRCSDWNARTLSLRQQQYAAGDAYYARECALKLWQLAADAGRVCGDDRAALAAWLRALNMACAKNKTKAVVPTESKAIASMVSNAPTTPLDAELERKRQRLRADITMLSNPNLRVLTDNRVLPGVKISCSSIATNAKRARAAKTPKDSGIWNSIREPQLAQLRAQLQRARDRPTMLPWNLVDGTWSFPNVWRSLSAGTHYVEFLLPLRVRLRGYTMRAVPSCSCRGLTPLNWVLFALDEDKGADSKQNTAGPRWVRLDTVTSAPAFQYSSTALGLAPNRIPGETRQYPILDGPVAARRYRRFRFVFFPGPPPSDFSPPVRAVDTYETKYMSVDDNDAAVSAISGPTDKRNVISLAGLGLIGALDGTAQATIARVRRRGSASSLAVASLCNIVGGDRANWVCVKANALAGRGNQCWMPDRILTRDWRQRSTFTMRNREYHWVLFDLPCPVRLVGYAMRARAFASRSTSPRSWIIQGSDAAGDVWTTLASERDATPWEYKGKLRDEIPGEARAFACLSGATEACYTKIRFLFWQGYSRDTRPLFRVQLAQIALYGAPQCDVKLIRVELGRVLGESAPAAIESILRYCLDFDPTAPFSM